MTIWRIIAHHTDRTAAVAWAREHRRIAIGWGKIGDIARYNSVDEIKAAIKEKYPVPEYKNNAGNGGPSLWDFANTLKKGDLVIISGDKGQKLVVETVGDYEFVEEKWPLDGEYYYQRTVELTRYDGNEIWRMVGGVSGVSPYRTLVKCQREVDMDEL